MGVILLKGIKLYAHHGCMPEETIIGSDYEVDVVLEADLSEASNSDELSNTLDYVIVHQIVADEMKIPSKLLEHVVQRIMTNLLRTYSEIQALEVSVAKINPPINGNVNRVVVKEIFKK
jgi:7,8-dihydroneopterin aldolase/epimerase/oxygenase